MALVGYVRVSTAAQEGALQRDALVKAGCSKLFEDKASGVRSDRPGLNDALAYIRAGTYWWSGSWIAWDGRCHTLSIR